ncbi:MAG: peptidoglycan-associated lipoprotein, partial [Verrucomicrobia bacterium]|nr:peptidoglycan-associated lipoprotein [Verrucomicrobiota bacterium]
YLTSTGVDGNKLQTISYGKEKPADLGHGEEAWAKNRRAEFIITGQ